MQTIVQAEATYPETWQREPSFCTLVTDPIAQALMRSDGVGLDDLQMLMAATRRSLQAQGRLRS